MNESSYYLKVSGQVEGPFTIGQIYDLWAARKINSQTPFARYDAMENWIPLSDLTLKVSAPRSAANRPQPEGGAATPAQPKSKASSPQWNEEQMPNFPEYVLPPQAEEVGKSVDSKSSFSAPTKVSLASWAWLCVASGLAIAIGFMFFPLAPKESMNIEPGSMIVKLSGVIGGVGLFLLGGLLAVARSMEQIAQSLRSELRQNGDRKSGK